MLITKPHDKILLKTCLDGDKVLEGLGHLAAFDLEVPGMQEVVDPLLTAIVCLTGESRALDFGLQSWCIMEYEYRRPALVRVCSKSFFKVGRQQVHTSDWAISLSW